MTSPLLKHFVDAWMHQDCDLDYGDISGAAADYASNPRKDVEGLLRELRDVLDRCPREAQLHRAFDEMNAQYVPQRPGEFRRQLLGAVIEFEKATADRVLMRSALAALLRSWYSGSAGLETTLAGLGQEERRVLRDSLRSLLRTAIKDPGLITFLHATTGEAVAAPVHEVRGRLQAVVDALDAAS